MVPETLGSVFELSKLEVQGEFRSKPRQTVCLRERSGRISETNRVGKRPGRILGCSRLTRSLSVS